ncbi:MAG TPA: N-acetylglucosamine-6-phosphate deacetylase [Thermoanaerobaculia bacterium]|jgi:N-acetylglucosamine-6-phosphate deacetylase|nr:N-acetylglucosamine-6-phosphate deacetylase [Thermoanaerobaculia bacterium]
MTAVHLYGRAFLDGAIEPDVLVTIQGGVLKIEQTAHPPVQSQRIAGIMAPGFIDLHVHGGDGADFMDADASATERILRFHARHGTTALAATTLSASPQDLHAAVASIASVARSARAPTAGAEICAIHLEGPYISRERAGAQDPASIRRPDLQEVEALLALAPRMKWLMTVAPEIEGVRGLIERYRDRITFSIGHTAAGYAEAVAALAWGASHFTHLFNAMSGLHHRDPGVAGAALTSASATAELIADGVHVHPAVLRLAAQAMPHRIALITDAMRACGLADGIYKLYHHDVTVGEGAARLGDGTLAGSVLTLERAVQTMVEQAGLPLTAVLPLATEVPARILGIADRKGKLAEGYDADIVVLAEKLAVERVFVRGREERGGSTPPHR